MVGLTDLNPRVQFCHGIVSFCYLGPTGAMGRLIYCIIRITAAHCGL